MRRAPANRGRVKLERRDLLAHLALAAAIGVVAWPLWAGQVLYYGDITLQFIPWRSFARAELLDGRLPLWLPDVYLGTPFLANDQSAVLYPWHWLSLLLSPARQISLGCLLHLQLAASGMYCCGRRRGRSRAAAVCGALAFGLGGFVLTKQQFPSLAYTVAWLPWLAWAALRLEGRGLCVAVAVVAVQWLAGHAQISVMTLALVTAWQLTRPGGRGARVRWLMAVGWGTALAAPQLLPTAELLGWSARGGFGLADAARFNLPPWQLPQLALSGCFGRPDGPVPYFGVGAFWETSCWTGLLAVPLAFAGARRRPAWLVVAGLSLLLAMGTYTPLYPLLVELLPPLTIFRDPARFTLYATFALAWLAADGYDLAPDGARRWMVWLAIGAAASWLLTALLPASARQAWLGWLLARAPSKQVSDVASLAAGWQAVAGGQLLLAAALLGGAARVPAAARRWWPVLLAAELVWVGQGVNPVTDAASFAAPPPAVEALPSGLLWIGAGELETVARHCFDLAHYPAPPRVAAARATLVGNVIVGTGRRQCAGYDPLRTAAILAWLAGVEALPAADRERTLAALGCRGEWSGGAWRPYAAVRDEVRVSDGAVAWREPSPQRAYATAAGGGRLAWTRAWLPGWHGSGARDMVSWSASEAVWECGDGAVTLRLWYAPTAWRVGLFLGLLALAAWVAAVTGCSTSVADRISECA